MAGKKTNPDIIIEALEKVLTRYGVTLKASKLTGICIFDKDGMEVCNFNSLDGHMGPIDLEIGHSYEDVYSTEAR